MKLDRLLAPYLYQHKKLNLPGIGTFEADTSTVVPEDNDKHHTQVQGITFKQHSDPEPEQELIEYIKMQTGKMKPLAMADLESFLMLVKQFLNIGKPFYIEGIGTLQKTVGGSLHFTPGEYIISRPGSNTQEPAPTAKKIAPEGKAGARNVILTLAAITTLAIIGWGGYYLYQLNADKENQEAPVPNTVTLPVDTTQTPVIQPDSSLLIKDTTVTPGTTDTTTVKPSPVAAPTGAYTFVFETITDKGKALYRYNYLHKINPKIRLQAKSDSSSFKLYVVLSAMPADTARTKDSLNMWYYGKKELRVKIEH